MNVGSVSDISAFQAIRTQEQIAMAVFRKTLDVAEAQGDAAISLLESAAETADQIQEAARHQLDVTA